MTSVALALVLTWLVVRVRATATAPMLSLPSVPPASPPYPLTEGKWALNVGKWWAQCKHCGVGANGRECRHEKGKCKGFRHCRRAQKLQGDTDGKEGAMRWVAGIGGRYVGGKGWAPWLSCHLPHHPIPLCHCFPCCSREGVGVVNFKMTFQRLVCVHGKL